MPPQKHARAGRVLRTNRVFSRLAVFDPAVGINEPAFHTVFLLRDPGVDPDVLQALPIDEQRGIAARELFDPLAGEIVALRAEIDGALAGAHANFTRRITAPGSAARTRFLKIAQIGQQRPE